MPITSEKTRTLEISIDVPSPTVMAMGIGNVRHNGAYTIEGTGDMAPRPLLHVRSDSPSTVTVGEGLSDRNRSTYTVEDENVAPRSSTVKTNGPAPTIAAGGVGNANTSQYTIVPDPSLPVGCEKPPYRVPLMSEMAALPWNGHTVVSTFSGCGGTCTGYKMDGYKVAWANEFVPAAQDTYRQNHPNTILDVRDIRTVQPQEILDAVGLKAGELDVLEGSPPCASFSTAGKREDGWNKVKAYSDTKQRTDDLFFEFVRLLAGLKPKVFTAENVSGLVKGVAKGYFQRIYRAFQEQGYVVEARLLDAQWLGVPQQRQRIIFVGVRQDIADTYGVRPCFPSPLPYRYSVRDAIPWICQVGTAPPHAEFVLNRRDVSSTMVDAGTNPSPTIIAGGINKGVGFVESRVIHDTSGDRSIGDVTDRPCPTITVGMNSINSHHYQVEEVRAVSDPRPGGMREDLSPHDGHRTAYDDRPSPTVLAQDHGFSDIAVEYAADPRARQVAPSDPAPSVLTHGRGWNQMAVQGKVERRKFTIAELRRICAFPDDFILTGTYAQQWERLGRSVPPVMAYHIAHAVRVGILDRIAEQDRRQGEPARRRFRRLAS